MADITISDANFKAEVLDEKSMPVIVDFWAPWCGPCKVVGPIIEELATEYAGKVKVGKMNVDENPEASGTYGIMSIPTIMFFKNGQPVKSVIGAQPKEALKHVLDEVLA
jgi:thioredoxin 1